MQPDPVQGLYPRGWAQWIKPLRGFYPLARLAFKCLILGSRAVFYPNPLGVFLVKFMPSAAYGWVGRRGGGFGNDENEEDPEADEVGCSRRLTSGMRVGSPAAVLHLR